MSRIFDALRRLSKANANHSSNRPPGDASQWRDLRASFESRAGGFEQAERVVCQPRPEEHVVAIGQNHSPGQEVFRVLCHRLQQVRQQRPLSAVLVTSAIPKEGKTVVAINLAAILARTSPRVLLVDADLRHPGIDRALGLRSLVGLADFLEDRIELAATCLRVDPMGFYYLPPGHPSSNPVELLQKPKLQELVSQKVAAFDWIVLDSPPLNLFADARHLATLADAVLLVAREGLTPREAAEQGLAALEGAFTAGVVLNASTNSNHDRYYHSYDTRPTTGPRQTKHSPRSEELPRNKEGND